MLIKKNLHLSEANYCHCELDNHPQQRGTKYILSCDKGNKEDAQLHLDPTLKVLYCIVGNSLPALS